MLVRGGGKEHAVWLNYAARASLEAGPALINGQGANESDSIVLRNVVEGGSVTCESLYNIVEASCRKEDQDWIVDVKKRDITSDSGFDIVRIDVVVGRRQVQQTLVPVVFD